MQREVARQSRAEGIVTRLNSRWISSTAQAVDSLCFSTAFAVLPLIRQPAADTFPSRGRLRLKTNEVLETENRPIPRNFYTVTRIFLPKPKSSKMNKGSDIKSPFFFFHLASFFKFMHAKVSKTCIFSLAKPLKCVYRIKCFSFASANTAFAVLPLIRQPVADTFPSRGRLFFIHGVSCGFHFVSLPHLRCYPSSVSLRLTPSPQGEGFDLLPAFLLLN